MQDVIIPPRIAKAVENARLPANYKAAVTAIAKCASIDECKDWADKFAALASYAKQLENVELENYCRRIRARASRRCGELLRELDDRGAHMKKKKEWHHLSRTEAAERAGLSEYQRKSMVRIACIPADEFEAQVESPHPPGTSILAKLGKQMRPKKEEHRSIDGAELHALMESGSRRRAIETLLQLQRLAPNCDVVALAGDILKNKRDLPRVIEALEFADRIGKALKPRGPSTVLHFKPLKPVR